jgi:hypothetical protein
MSAWHLLLSPKDVQCRETSSGPSATEQSTMKLDASQYLSTLSQFASPSKRIMSQNIGQPIHVLDPSNAVAALGEELCEADAFGTNSVLLCLKSDFPNCGLWEDRFSLLASQFLHKD